MPTKSKKSPGQVSNRHAELLMQMGDGKIGPELACLLGSRYKILYVTTNEERRVIDCFKLVSAAEGFKLYQWDQHRGLVDLESNKQVSGSDNEMHTAPEGALGWILEQAKADYKAMREGKERPVTGYVYLMLDMHHYFRDEGAPMIERMLKEFASIPSACCVVIVSPLFECPSGLESEVTLIDFPYPSKSEIKRSLKVILKDIKVNFPEAKAFVDDREEDLLNSVSGLTLTEAENAFAKSLVKHGQFDIPTILEEKKQIIRKNGILEYRDAKFTFDDIGGLDTLKNWLDLRQLGFKQDAIAYGLTVPKGMLLIGVPGTGKSMTCVATAHRYNMPLLRLDMGAIFAGVVGESEKNIREVIKISEAVAPCIVWIDEIEKALGGVKSSNYSDSGVTNRVFGSMLTWMSDKDVPVFVVCTANNVTDLPPEFLRAGRFDEIFFVDLPNSEQRYEVTECLLRRKQRDPAIFGVQEIVQSSEYYSPAEIEKGINNALFLSYADGRREVTTADIISELGKFEPLYNSKREEIVAMREWALGEEGKGGRAVLANSPKEEITIDPNAVSRGIHFSEKDV